MKLAIIGSRTIIDKEKIFLELEEIYKTKKIDLVVSGGAKGPDSIGEYWAKEKGIPVKVFLPDWVNLGKSAGMIRNKDIIQECDMVIAFWDGKSKGTLNAIEIAKKMNKKVKILNCK